MADSPARDELPPPTRFLTVSGILFADNRLLLHPGFLTDDPADPSGEGEESLLAELVDEGGRVLLRHRLGAARFVTDGEPMAERAVLGKLPFPPETRTVRFLRDGLLLHELDVPESPPQVRLEWEPPDRPEGRQVIKWSGEHPDGLSLHFLPCYSNDGGKSFRPLSLPTEQSSVEVDFDLLPGGRARVALLATDGANTVRAESRVFKVDRRPCLATILSPEPGTTVPGGEEVWLQGQGYYLEEARAELEQLEWESSLDGSLGSGAIVAVILSEGVHTITLRAGTARRQGETSIELRCESG
jgi:hypothetical protein